MTMYYPGTQIPVPASQQAGLANAEAQGAGTAAANGGSRFTGNALLDPIAQAGSPANDQQAVDYATQAMANNGGGGGSKGFDPNSILNNLPSGWAGLPDGNGHLIVYDGSGKLVGMYDSGGKFTPSGGLGGGTGTGAQETAADKAAAGLYQAQADDMRAQTQQRQIDAANAGKPVLDGEGQPTGYQWDGKGGIIDVAGGQVNLAKANVLKGIADGSIQAPPGFVYDKATGALVADPSQMTAAEKAQIALNTENDLATQQNNTARLALDQATAEATSRLNQADTAGKYELQAEQLAAQVADAEGTRALQQQQESDKILSSPSDFIAEAFRSRGQTAPNARITQADLLNQLNGNAVAGNAADNQAVANARAIASRFQNMPDIYGSSVQPAIPAAGPRLTATGAVAGLPTTTTPPDPFAGFRQQAAIQAAQGIKTTGYGPNGTVPGIPPAPGPVPAAADGGTFPPGQVVEVGDSKTGKPNEEYVIDMPNDGGLMVVPKSRIIGKRMATGGSSTGSSDSISRFTKAPAAADGGIFGLGAQAGANIGNTLPSENTPNSPTSSFSSNDPLTAIQGSGTQAGADVSYLMGGQKALNAGLITPDQFSTLQYQLSHGGWTPGNDPNAPSQADLNQITQDQLVAKAKLNAPPAVTALLNGSNIPAFIPAEPSITPHRLSLLTTPEQQALNSYLGVVDNTTLQNETQGVAPLYDFSKQQPQSRFSVTGGR